jgi:hypothetical protein
LKQGVEDIQAIQHKIIANHEHRSAPLNLSFADVGLSRHGWLNHADKAGVSYSREQGDSESVPVSWADFGAKTMIHLAEKTLSLDGETLQQVAVAATMTEDFAAAQRLFARLLTADPQRVKNVTTYFERAQTGYQNSAEGSARTRFAASKALFKDRKFADGMQLLTGLQQELAANSSLQSLLKEVDRYRSTMRRQFQIDDAGNPITAFERLIRAVFGGEVKVDQSTGEIEACYDFSNIDQLRDWSIIEWFGKDSVKPDWRPGSGVMNCAGMNTILAWKFPVDDFSVTADVTYLDSSHRFVIYSCMNKEKPYGIWAWCREGRAKIWKGKVSDFGWYSSARFIWRPGEKAEVTFGYDGNSEFPFGIEVNHHTGVRGQLVRERGLIGFSFDGGRGTIGNVRIKGTLDPQQLKQLMDLR